MLADMEEKEKNVIFFKIKGVSMNPFFKTGDMFIVKKIDAKKLIIGDIISYYSEQHPNGICHRLIRKVYLNGVCFLYVRGDAYTGALELVDEKALFGKVIAVIKDRRIKNVSSPYQQFINYCIVIFLPIFLRIYYKTKSVVRPWH